MKNGNRQKFTRLFFRKSYYNRRNKEYVRFFMIELRQKILKPKMLRSVVPLVIMLIFVALLLSNVLYFSVVTSDSMSPTFNKGDLVLMTDRVNLEEDDIIIMRAPGVNLPVMHRAVKIEDDNVTTKGDFVPEEDTWDINKGDIYGEAITINGDPIVLKGVGTYFLDEDASAHDRYTGEMEVTRLFLSSMKGFSVMIFVAAVSIYIILMVREIKYRK
jgi:signal peptidase